MKLVEQGASEFADDDGNSALIFAVVYSKIDVFLAMVNVSLGTCMRL
jgi:hypothetical protein